MNTNTCDNDNATYAQVDTCDTLSVDKLADKTVGVATRESLKVVYEQIANSDCIYRHKRYKKD